MSIQGSGIGAEWGLMVHNITRRDPWQEKGGGTDTNTTLQKLGGCKGMAVMRMQVINMLTVLDGIGGVRGSVSKGRR